MSSYFSQTALWKTLWWFALPAGAALVVLGLMALLGRIPLVYNVRNLLVRWKTTALTALAFTLVISLLTVMLAFVNGMVHLTETSGQPGNLLVLARGQPDEAFSSLAVSDIGDIENQAGILRENGRPLCSAETYIVVNQPVPHPVPGRPKRRFVQIRGVDDTLLAARVHGLELLDGGKRIASAGVEKLAPESGRAAAPITTVIQAVLGEGIARALGHDRPPDERLSARNSDRLAAGDLFTLGDRQWIVADVMRSAGSTFDSEVWAKGSIVRPMFGKKTYSSVVLRSADEATAQQVKAFFNNKYKKAAVQAQTETEYFASLSATNRQFLYAISFVAIFVALGGIFGVMNTMFAAISQRSKDIGVLRIIGFARSQILVSFLLESLAIALFGGLLGLGLGMLCHGWTASSVVGSGQGGGKFVVLRLIVDGRIICVDLLLILVMGLVGGLLPALSAIRQRPLEALR